MAAYEVLLLNTAVPQIQAAQSGDTYVVPRDIAFSAALTLSAGTANGVPYLNGSKVLTTGSALTFDGANLGIGTSSPQAKLHVDGGDFRNSSGTLPALSTSIVSGEIHSGLSNASTSDSGYLRLSAGGGTTLAVKAAIDIFREAGGATGVLFYTAGTEQMRLTSTGLGIGTSSPITKLHTSSYAAIGATIDRVGDFGQSLQLVRNGVAGNAGLGLADNNALGVYLNSSEVGRWTSTGLGIGTSSPGYKLDVAGSGRFGTGTGNPIVFINGGSSSGNGGYVQFQKAGANNFYVGHVSGVVGGTSNDGLLYNSSGNGLQIYTNNALAATLDSPGNLGLGVTPSAWNSSYRALQVGGSGISAWTTSGSGGNLYLSNNVYFDGSNRRYIANAAATEYEAGSVGHVWKIAASGTLGNAITFTQAMTLDASGNLLVGQTSGSNKLSVTTSGTSLAALVGAEYSQVNIIGGSQNFYIQNYNSVSIIGTKGASPLLFTTNEIERARITSGGYFKSSNNGTYQGSTGSYHEFTQTGSATTLYVRNSVASGPFGLELLFSAASPDDNTQWFLKASDSTTTRCYIWSDGDLANHDGVYGTISDQKLKQDIVDAGSQWDDLKAIRFRKYRMKSDVAANPDAPVLLGVIAQELEQVSPGLVDEHPDVDSEGNDLGTTTKTVKSSILLMKAAVALQEAMARIEHLEAKVSALESKGA